VNAFWASGLGFHCLPLFSSFSFFFSFLMLTATKKICINVFIIVNYEIGMASPRCAPNAPRRLEGGQMPRLALSP
jgi:hypothetical protein